MQAPGDHPPHAGNVVSAHVLTVSYLGSRYEYDLKVGDHVVQVVSDRGGLAGTVQFTVPPEAALVYTDADVLSDDAQALLTVSP